MLSQVKKSACGNVLPVGCALSSSSSCSGAKRLAVVDAHAEVQRHAIAEPDVVVDERADVAELSRHS